MTTSVIDRNIGDAISGTLMRFCAGCQAVVGDVAPSLRLTNQTAVRPPVITSKAGSGDSGMIGGGTWWQTCDS